MDYTQFTASLTHTEPPVGLSLALQGLWWQAKGEWNHAHECARQDDTVDGSSVHAHLHRAEGDVSNAGYWYRRARRTPATGSLREEWETLAREML